MGYPFGVTPPMFDVEKMFDWKADFDAFNMFALQHEDLDGIVNAVVEAVQASGGNDCNIEIDGTEWVGRPLTNYEKNYIVREVNRRL